MVWENQCSCILMLCQTNEKGQVSPTPPHSVDQSLSLCIYQESSYCFWPEEGESEEKGKVYGKLRVRWERECLWRYHREETGGWGGGGERWETADSDSTSVEQLATWELPHPTAILSVVDMLSKVQRSTPQQAHCHHVQVPSPHIHNLHSYHIISLSDGVGRTGTFMCVHSQLERLKTEGVVDIFQAVKSARIQRAGLVSDVVSTLSLPCLTCLLLCVLTGPVCLLLWCSCHIPGQFWNLCQLQGWNVEI